MNPPAKKIIYVFIALFALNVLVALALLRHSDGLNPRVVFVDVGQGDSTYIEDENSDQILIDGGDGKLILDRLGKLMPFYDRKIELVIMTHPDKDHMGGLIEVLKYYEVEDILETGIKCDTAICKEWDKLIEEKNIPVKYARFGQDIRLGKYVDIKVLYPFDDLSGQKVGDDNDSSIIVKIFTPNNSYLLMGDAGFKLEQILMSSKIDLQAKILRVSHHGSKNATSNEFLQAVKPEKAIISVGKNSYGHPTIELLNRVRNVNAQILRTDEEGDLIFY